MGKSPGPGQRLIHAQSDRDTLSVYQTDIPPPEVAAGWERVQPGAADRILSMAEKALENDQRIERSECRRQTATQLFGMASGFLISLGALGGGIYLILHDKNAQGLTALVSALAIVFLSLTKGGK